jgi:nitrite reductase/ring-hydroxylating ferredoxin subunit/predicted secreted protein
MRRRRWHRAVASADLAAGTIVAATVGKQRLLVARLTSGSAVAFATRCPHQDTDLRDALMGDDTVRCPRHDYVYDARTGENVLPARDPTSVLWEARPGYLPVYRVEERDGWVWVDPRPLPPPPAFDPALEEQPVGADVVEDIADGIGDGFGEGIGDGIGEGIGDGRVLRVGLGSTFEIRLPTNPLPGHTWEVRVGRRLRVLEEGLLPADPPRWRVRLSARKEGEDEVQCAFRRPWDVEPSERRRYVVRVVRDAPGPISARG